MFRVCPDASWKALEGLNSRSRLRAEMLLQRGVKRKELTSPIAGEEEAVLAHPSSRGKSCLESRAFFVKGEGGMRQGRQDAGAFSSNHFLSLLA